LGLYPGVKRPGCGVDSTPSSSTQVKERVKFYIFSPSGLFSVKIIYPEMTKGRYKFTLNTSELNVLQMDHHHHRMDTDHVHTTTTSGVTGDGGHSTDECSSMEHHSMMMVRGNAAMMMHVFVNLYF
jgi:hypothetical protein